MTWTVKGRLESAQGDNVRLAECRVEVSYDTLIRTGGAMTASASVPRGLIEQPLGIAPAPATGTEDTTPAAGYAGSAGRGGTIAAAESPPTSGSGRSRRRATVDAAASTPTPGASIAPAASDRVVALAGPIETTARTAKGRATAITDSLGKFEVELPDPSTLATKKLRFVVSAPSGQSIADETRDYDRLDDLVRIEVRKVEAIPLAPPTDPPKPETRRVTGRIIERNGKTLPASLQVLIFARTIAATPSTPSGSDGGGVAAMHLMPVFVARADSSGYFFGPVPNRGFDQAAALVSGFAEEIPIPLEDHLIPNHVVLVVELDQMIDGPEEVDCSDRKLPPRTPTQSDLANAPETYSTDLGTGGCVVFNTPNRSIEEFDFYSVVRTTEPEIKGYTLDPVRDPTPTLPSEPTGTSGGGGRPDGGTAPSVINAASFEVSIDTGDRGTWGAIQVYLLSADGSRYTVYQKPSVNAIGGLFPNLNDPNQAALQLSANSRTVSTATVNANGITAIGMDLAQVRRIELDWSESNTGDAWAFRGIQVVAMSPQGARVPIRINDALAYGEAPEIRRFGVQFLGNAADAHRWEGTARVDATDAPVSMPFAMTGAAVSPGALAGERMRVRPDYADLRQVATKPPGRSDLNAANAPDWDSTPTFYEAATIAHGHLLHFKQVWYADGYSLGDLLYSLPLAPGQKKLISVIDWERRERAERGETTFGTEALDASLTRDRDLGEVVTGALTESARGGSKSTSAGVGVGTGAAGNGTYEGMNFGALVGVSGGYGEANSDAWQDSVRTLSSSSVQNLRDRTLQSASAVRGTRSSVVHSVSQGEAVRATTEVVANHNHCHALTIQYFEVLRHLKLVHELADVRECLFVPLPMTAFDREKVLRWRQSLEVYLKRRDLAGGFDSTRRVVTNWTEVDYPGTRYGDEMIESIAGEFQLTVMIPMPPFPERPKPDPAEAATDAAAKMAQAVNPTTGPLGILLAVATGGASLIAGAVTDAAVSATKAATQGARAMADELYSLSPQERYDKFQQEVMPGVVEGFVNQLELWALVGTTERRIGTADFTLVSNYSPATPLLASVRANISGQIRRSEMTQLIVKSAAGLPSGCRIIVNNATIRYRTRSFEHGLVDDLRVNDDIDLPKVSPFVDDGWQVTIKRTSPGTGATLFTPLDSWEQRNPRLDDIRLSAEIVDHLNDNLEFYHHVIWWTMDPNRRYMLLDGYYAPGSGDRSVASVVDNRLIGIVGNSLVMPVAAGVHLDPRFRRGSDAVDLMSFYTIDPPVPPSRVSLPTRGVFAEAVMGKCNACEEIDDTRYWRWEDSPIDEAPAIEPASTATRRAEPPSLSPTPFPTPIVAIQNAPAAPDPAGVAAALNTIAQQSFRDITGLAGTQANAAAAYSQALDTAYKFGKEASTLAQQAGVLAQQQGMQKNIDKTLGAIDKAEAGGKIDAAEAKQLRTTALKKLVGDGSTVSSAASTAEKMKAVQDAVNANAIQAQDGRELSKTILGAFAGGDVDQRDRNAAANLLEQVPARSVTRLETPGGVIMNASLTDVDPSRIAGEPTAYLWSRLLAFRPPQNLLDALAARGLSWQRIHDGRGEVNLDQYPLVISQLPTDPQTGATFEPEAFFVYVRSQFPKLLPQFPAMGGGPSFQEYEAADKTTWDSANPLGAVMEFGIDAFPGSQSNIYEALPVPEWGLVLCAEFVTDATRGDWHWNFVTLHGPLPIGYHPVSGTRQFGLQRFGTTYAFYVRAADRASTFWENTAELAAGVLFAGTEEYWNGFFSNLQQWINSHGGTSEMKFVVSQRVPWSDAITFA